MTRPILITLLIIASLAIFATDAAAQYRDHMTDAEIELIRDAQDIDLRIDTLTKMIDRRFAVLGIESGGEKIKEKHAEKWGPEPTGSRIELFNDIGRLLQKAVDDIDDIAGRNELSQTQNRMEGKLFPKAVRMLAAAAARYKPLLETAGAGTEDKMLRGNLSTAITICEQIIESLAKLPPEVKK
jgi:hypothetical protein